MPKFSRAPGATSQKFTVYIQNITTGAALTGLTSGSAGLICYYRRENDAADTQVVLSAGTVGTFGSGTFVEVNAAHEPGAYQICLPDAAFTTGNGGYVFAELSGAANMAPCPLEVDLAAKVTILNVQGFAKNTARAGFVFPMYDSTGTLKPGLSGFTAQVTRDGAAVASLTNAVTEISGGFYTIDLTAADLNGNNCLLHFAATNAVSTEITVYTVT